MFHNIRNNSEFCFNQDKKGRGNPQQTSSFRTLMFDSWINNKDTKSVGNFPFSCIVISMTNHLLQDDCHPKIIVSVNFIIKLICGMFLLTFPIQQYLSQDFSWVSGNLLVIGDTQPNLIHPFSRQCIVRGRSQVPQLPWMFRLGNLTSGGLN